MHSPLVLSEWGQGVGLIVTLIAFKHFPCDTQILYIYTGNMSGGFSIINFADFLANKKTRGNILYVQEVVV